MNGGSNSSARIDNFASVNALASIVAGRRAKWVVLVVWLVAVVVMTPLGSKLADETTDDTASFLPESAESTRVVETLDAKFPAQETSQGLIVYQRDGGLTAADKAKIAEDAKALADLPKSELPLTQAPIVPFGQAGFRRPGLGRRLARVHDRDRADELRQVGRLGQAGP